MVSLLKCMKTHTCFHALVTQKCVLFACLSCITRQCPTQVQGRHPSVQVLECQLPGSDLLASLHVSSRRHLRDHYRVEAAALGD